PKLEERKTAAVSDFVPTPDLEWFADRLAQLFASRLSAWRKNGLGPILNEFLVGSIHKLGAHVAVHDTDGSRIEGVFAGLEEIDGGLRLRLADGSQRVIRAGDIL
ncbi:MAG: biotin--[acetyl-CoA-carboxylase] ligase, partial [Pseudomonadota bacterium]